MKKNLYQSIVHRVLKNLAVDSGNRSKEENRKIKKLVYEAITKETLSFIWAHLDPLKRLAFKQDIIDTNGDFKKLKNVISSYYRIIPNHRVQLEQRLKAFETHFYAKLLKNGNT